jgi:hypothetical protein
MPDKIETEQIQPRYAAKTLEALRLIDKGIEPKQALQVTNLKHNISRGAIHNLKKKYAKYSLTAPKIQKLAHKALLDCLNGETSEYTAQKVTKAGDVIDYQEVIAPSVTNKIAAAAMVYDRVEPAIRQQVNVNLEVHPVDLSNFSNRVIDVTPEDNKV